MYTEYIELESDSAEAALEELATYSYEQGYVNDSYIDALLERERAHPTGLKVDKETNPFGIAIPHADPDYVSEQAVLLGIPESTATFRNMDNENQEVEVSAVILLLVTESENYSTFLSDLTTLFQSDKFAKNIVDKDVDSIINLINRHVIKE
jgi:PTS system galactitol-specific IIA component